MLFDLVDYIYLGLGILTLGIILYKNVPDDDKEDIDYEEHLGDNPNIPPK